MEQKIQQIEKKVKRLLLMNVLLFAVIIGMAAAYFLKKPAQVKQNDVLRARGIIIEDSLGHERILIGAPVPYAKNRVRTNHKRAMDAWSKYFSDAYPKFYKDYNHNANGIIILDEKGFDKIAIGDPTPDPNIGKRIAPATGIQINDDLGFERSGYGLLRVDSVYRVVLGFDSKYGTEGMFMLLTDDGVTGLGIRDHKKEIFLGNTFASDFDKEWKGKFSGLLIRDSTAIKFKVDANAKAK